MANAIKQEKKVSRWQNLIDRREELLRLGQKEYFAGRDSVKYDMEMDCIDHLFECEGIQTYEQIALFCKEHGIERAIDIGCAYGHQSEAFLVHGVDYVGVDDYKNNFWNQDSFRYIVGRYPRLLPAKKGDLGVSVLCLTWNCYLYEKEKTLTEQCEALTRDFDHCLLYITEEAKDFVSRYFPNVEKLGRNLFYFSK